MSTFFDILGNCIKKKLQDNMVVLDRVKKRMKRKFRFPNKKRKYLEDSAEKKCA